MRENEREQGNVTMKDSFHTLLCPVLEQAPIESVNKSGLVMKYMEITTHPHLSQTANYQPLISFEFSIGLNYLSCLLDLEIKTWLD